MTTRRITHPVVSAITEQAPQVSVAMITYNHERYIAKAIESVLAQETPFPIELVIGDDCSRDRTREIVQKYADAHPRLITPLFHSRNLGMHANHRAVLAACRGEFVAFLEGDDYWTSSLKLARQVEFLHRHQSAAGCFHRVVLVDENNAPTGMIRPPASIAQLTTDDLIVANSLDTCSVMVRRTLLSALPPEFDQLPMADWPTWIFTSLQGPFVNQGDTMGAYRVHSAGAWSSMAGEKQIRAILELYRLLARYLERNLRSQIARCRKDILERLILHLVTHGRWQAARPLALRWLLLRPRPPTSRVMFHLRLLFGWPSKEMLKLAAISSPGSN